jgi:predicted dehydrogenase
MMLNRWGRSKIKMSNEVSRRDVLRGSAAAIAGLAAAKVVAEPTEQAPNPHKFRVGLIGCGGQGRGILRGAAGEVETEVVALCDVDAEARSKTSMDYPRASTFNDYRVMIEEMKGRMDGVMIATPDHHHTPASILAMKAGMHVYTEKPLTRSIWESRELAKVARQTKRMTQMGNHSTASTPMRKIAALIKSGQFGAVKEVHLWTNRPIWPQGQGKPEVKPTPKPIDFDLWVGPRPETPFGAGYHPFDWRGWWEFGTGALGDMGCHIFNSVHMALDLRDPIAVQAQTSGHNKISFPSWSIVTYEFAAKGKQPPFKLFWYDGGKKPPASLLPDIFKMGGNGVIIVCEKNTIFSPNEGNVDFRLVDGEDLPDIKVVESPGHIREWINASLGKGPEPASNFPNYAGPLTETVLIGNLAVWANGPRLEWDARRMAVKGTNEYDSLIKPVSRPGWSI